MDATKLEKLAAGRVYTGRQAKELGLVDELGTLDDAIVAARSLAGMDGGDTELKILPEAPSFLDSLLGPFGGTDRDTHAPATRPNWPRPSRCGAARPVRAGQRFAPSRSSPSCRLSFEFANSSETAGLRRSCRYRARASE